MVMESPTPRTRAGMTEAAAHCHDARRFSANHFTRRPPEGVFAEWM